MPFEAATLRFDSRLSLQDKILRSGLHSPYRYITETQLSNKAVAGIKTTVCAEALLKANLNTSVKRRTPL